MRFHRKAEYPIDLARRILEDVKRSLEADAKTSDWVGSREMGSCP